MSYGSRLRTFIRILELTNVERGEVIVVARFMDRQAYHPETVKGSSVIAPNELGLLIQMNNYKLSRSSGSE